MMRSILERVAAAEILICGFTHSAFAVEPQQPVPPEVQAYVVGIYGTALDARVFAGDFSGDGDPDAIAFIYYPLAGGNSFGLDVSLFERRGGALTHKRVVENVFGTDPREVLIAPGLIEVTTTTMNPGDPRCCPTGRTRYEIKP